MIVPIQRTAFDLNFRLFRIPVRVHPTYWLVSLLFVAYLPIRLWPILIGCMFLSLLAHEMGHALTFRRFRMDSAVVLYSFGGLAIPEGRLPERSQRILVALAGPATNFLIAGIAWGTNFVQPWADSTNPYLFIFYWALFYINLAWGIINLLPVYPLDGGQVSREVWLKYRPGMGVIYALRMSFIAAVAFSAYSFGCYFNVIPAALTIDWLRTGLFGAILFAILAVNNYQELQNETRRGSYWNDREPWR